jgi:drug/metabolite transporter (DMT)-like permease
MRKQGVLAGGAAAVTVVLWASAFVAIRQVGQDISAGALKLGRLLVGSVLLGFFVFTRPRRWPAQADWKLLLACGLLWFGVYNVALNEAERHLDAGTTAMLVNIGPLLIALLAGILLGEGFPRQLVIGSVVAFAGVVVIALSSSHGGADTWGVALCRA